MNAYSIVVFLSFIIYIIIGNFAGRKVHNLEDYYVSGRNAPTMLIVGTLISSFASTELFYGDTAFSYDGYVMLLVILATIMIAGYSAGTLYFGRYVRRSKALTVPEYFGKRFQSRKIQSLAGVITIFTVTAYLLAATQGTNLLMSELTGLEYKECLILTWLVYTAFTLYSGSRGIILTETIMFIIILLGIVIAAPFIFHNTGGGFAAVIEKLATFEGKPGIVSYHGLLGPWMINASDSVIWAITFGISWGIAIAVSPWQASRYLMAKSEHVVLRAGAVATMITILYQTLVFFMAGSINLVNPGIQPSEKAFIWAVYHLLPSSLSVLLLVGIMAAGLSSASTFLSLIGFSATKDVIEIKKNEKTMLRISRGVMLVSSLVALGLAYYQPPAVLWITYFAGTAIAAAWGPVALMSVWSKRITSSGALWGMLVGFVGNVGAKLIEKMTAFTFPMLLSPFFIGLLASIMTILVVSSLTKVTDKEKEYRKTLLIMPKEELDPKEIKRTLLYGKVMIGAGILTLVIFMFAYGIPYFKATAI